MWTRRHLVPCRRAGSIHHYPLDNAAPVPYMTSGYTHRPSDSYLYHFTSSSVLRSSNAATASGGPPVVRLLWLRQIAGTAGRRNWAIERPISSSTSEWQFTGRNFERFRKGGEVVSVGIVSGVKLLFLCTLRRSDLRPNLNQVPDFLVWIEMDRVVFALRLNLSSQFFNCIIWA